MPETADTIAIRAVVDRWIMATRAGDLDTVASLMTDDAVFQVPGQPPFGKAEFLAASRKMGATSIDAKSKIEELVVAGNFAYLRNRLDLVITPPGAAAIQKTGYSQTIFRKEQDGHWRLARDANVVI